MMEQIVPTTDNETKQTIEDFLRNINLATAMSDFSQLGNAVSPGNVTEKPYACEICYVRYSNSSDLMTHKSQIHPGTLNYNYEADIKHRNVSVQIINDKELKSISLKTLPLHHAQNLDEIKKNKMCDECKSNNADNLLNQIVLPSDRNTNKVPKNQIDPDKCAYCNKTLKHSYSSIAHINRNTNEEPLFNINKNRGRKKSYGNDFLGEKLFSCEICELKFSEKHAYKNHVLTHTVDKLYVCYYCDNKFETIDQLKQHKHSEHGLSSDINDLADRIYFPGEKPFKCETCGQRFTRKNNYKCHLKIHTGEKPFTCDICNENFIRKDHLKNHKRTHTGETYKCNLCTKTFSRIFSYNVHQRIHTGEKLFKCKVCNKQFTVHHNFRVHMRIHTGEKPYPCGTCGKQFSRRDTFTCHMKFHMKQVKCEFCDFRYINPKSYEKHLRKHSDGNNFTCNLCSRSFVRKDIYNSHMKYHGFGNPECDMCGRVFAQINTKFRKHLKRHAMQ